VHACVDGLQAIAVAALDAGCAGAALGSCLKVLASLQLTTHQVRPPGKSPRDNRAAPLPAKPHAAGATPSWVVRPELHPSKGLCFFLTGPPHLPTDHPAFPLRRNIRQNEEWQWQCSVIEGKTNKGYIIEGKTNKGCIIEGKTNKGCITEGKTNKSCIIEGETNKGCIIDGKTNKGSALSWRVRQTRAVPCHGG